MFNEQHTRLRLLLGSSQLFAGQPGDLPYILANPVPRRRGLIEFSCDTVDSSTVNRHAAQFTQTPCPMCGKKGGRMKTSTLDIPHFKDCVIIEYSCSACFFKSSELKSGGGVSAQGGRWVLKVERKEDLSRDLLKSNTARCSIPEFGFEMMAGSLGGIYTTVEGLLSKIHKKLSTLKNPHSFSFGRSTDNDTRRHTEFSHFLSNLESMKSGRDESFPWTLVIEDPMDQSIVYSSSQSMKPDSSDAALKYESYERTFAENAEFGIDDMETQQYAKCPDCNEWAEACTCVGGNDYPEAEWTHNRDISCWDFEQALQESLASGMTFPDSNCNDDY